MVQTDEFLVSRALDGDEGAFAALYHRHAPTLLARLKRILGHPVDAEDVLQAVFIEVSRHLNRYRPDKPFGAWLNGVAFNLATRELRAQRRRRWLVFGKEDTMRWAVESRSASPEKKAMEQEQLDRLGRAMEHLSPKSRVAFVLHEVEGLAVGEVGQMLGLSSQAVWNRVERARKEVLARLEALGVGEAPDASGGQKR